jgi:hypothetical protein
VRHTYTRTFNRFLLKGDLPSRLRVRDTAPPESATRLFSVVADYGWAERLLCCDCYRDDANDIAATIGECLDIPVTPAKEPAAACSV